MKLLVCFILRICVPMMMQVLFLFTCFNTLLDLGEKNLKQLLTKTASLKR